MRHGLVIASPGACLAFGRSVVISSWFRLPQVLLGSGLARSCNACSLYCDLVMSPVMPAALPVDQTLAKELYLNGMSLTQVSKRTGVKLMTLGAWKNRGNWDAERLQPDSSEDTAVQDAAKALSSQSLTLSSRVLCKAEKIGIESTGDLKNVAAAIASAVGVARKALGLDDNQVQRHVHVHVMDSCRSQAIVDTDVIDLPSEPAACPPAPIDRLLPVDKPQ